MITRKQYMENQDLHDSYYLQFAEAVKLRVSTCFSREEIKEALESDEHLNNISLARWDKVAKACKQEIAWKNKELGNGFVWSLSDGVCAAKAFARKWAQ